MEKRFIPAPIDNKHILDDFADDLHWNKCVEHRSKGIVRQAFYDGAVLWELIYTFGDNMCFLVVRSGTSSSSINKSMEKMTDTMLAMACEDNGLVVRCAESPVVDNSLIVEFLYEVE